MAVKSKTHFMCQACGEDFPRWEGRCSACGEWNTLVEEKVVPEAKATNPANWTGISAPTKPVPLTEVESHPELRQATGIGEFDRILGGGLVAGSVTLIGGEPGIGKSTLLLQVAARFAISGRRVLYVTGEESLEQIRMRGARLGAVSENVLCFAEVRAEAITNSMRECKPGCVIIDSIQTIYSGEMSGSPGSVSQIRESAALLVAAAKGMKVPVFLVGHLTKSGLVAGPRVLEHMVDTVLYFEGDPHHQYRMLRAVKNRFGSTNEVGIFRMAAEGLVEVSDPSGIFLQERPQGASGSVVVPIMEGSRPLLVEIQALSAPNGGFGAPRRTSTGIDSKRLALLLAVMEKRIGIRMMDQDVFLNIAGGVRVDEPATDLAAFCAVVSSHRSQPVADSTVVIGEIGLSGEIRSVSHLDQRISEAGRLGFKTAVCAGNPGKAGSRKIRVVPVRNVLEALKMLELV